MIDRGYKGNGRSDPKTREKELTCSNHTWTYLKEYCLSGYSNKIIGHKCCEIRVIIILN